MSGFSFCAISNTLQAKKLDCSLCIVLKVSHVSSLAYCCRLHGVRLLQFTVGWCEIYCFVCGWFLRSKNWPLDVIQGLFFQCVFLSLAVNDMCSWENEDLHRKIACTLHCTVACLQCFVSNFFGLKWLTSRFLTRNRQLVKNRCCVFINSL